MISSAVARGRPKRNSGQPVGIQTVETALDVLGIITQEGSAIGLSELSRRTGLIPSKLHRYLVTLVRYGVVKQSVSTGMYELGPTALRIGLAALNRHDAIGSAQEVVSALAANTGCSVGLYVWTELGPTLVRLEIGAYLPTVLRVGTALPLVHSATGRVFLAHLPASETARLLRKERADAKADGLDFPTVQEIAEMSQAIRNSEIYWTRDAIIPATVAVVPILRKAGDPLCSIVAILPRGRSGDSQKARVAEQLQAARDLLQKEIGFDIAGDELASPAAQRRIRELQGRLEGLAQARQESGKA